MNAEEICQELNQISTDELQQLEQLFPDDSISCFVLFTEMNRVSDYYGIDQNYSSNDNGVTIQIFD